ncbi:hypothetical protein JVU11DRAFT_9505 [Chiua virens]|nr:hypothetical protein JVU11DRAFT_9505 [Chiua virens]
MTSTPSCSYTGQSRNTYTTIRPWTARSGTTRPGTARPQTAASTRHEGSYVIALLESRGVAHEVGIAAMDKDTGRVMLVQVRPYAILSDLAHVLEAGRSPYVRQDAASDAHPLPLACARS